MNFTMSKDGNLRADLTIKMRLGFYDIAAAFVAYEWPISEQEKVQTIEKAKKLSKRAVKDVALDYIFQNGRDRLSYVIGDHDLDEVFEEVKQIFESRWGQQ